MMGVFLFMGIAHANDSGQVNKDFVTEQTVSVVSKEQLKLDDAEYKGFVISKSTISTGGFFFEGIALIGAFSLIGALFKSITLKRALGISLAVAAVLTFTHNTEAGISLATVGGIVTATEEEVLLGKIKSQTEEALKAKGFVSKKEVDDLVNERLKSLEGLDAAQLKAMIDADKGVLAMLKKQGEEINALKEKGGDRNPKSFKSFLNEKMGEIEKVFKAGHGHMTIELKSPAIMTTDNTVDYAAMPDDLIDSFSLGSFVAKRQPREYVFDLASVTTVAEVEKYKVWEEEGDEEGAFAIVEEGAVKPLVSYSLVKNISEARKVAGKYVVTEEFTKWRKKAYVILQRLIRQKMLRDYAAILTTDLLNDAAPYTGSALDGQYTDPTDYHAIAAVAAQIEGLDFAPDMLVLNPQDKWRIGMLQDSQGQFYLTIPVTDPSGQTKMMGFTVRTSNRIPVGTFILGESGLWEIEQEAIKIKVGYGIDVTTATGPDRVTSVSSDFDNNRFRVILETYFHNYIATPNIGSFVVADFDTVKSLLESGSGS